MTKLNQRFTCAVMVCRKDIFSYKEVTWEPQLHSAGFRALGEENMTLNALNLNLKGLKGWSKEFLNNQKRAFS